MSFVRVVRGEERWVFARAGRLGQEGRDRIRRVVRGEESRKGCRPPRSLSFVLPMIPSCSTREGG